MYGGKLYDRFIEVQEHFPPGFCCPKSALKSLSQLLVRLVQTAEESISDRLYRPSFRFPLSAFRFSKFFTRGGEKAHRQQVRAIASVEDVRGAALSVARKVRAEHQHRIVLVCKK